MPASRADEDVRIQVNQQRKAQAIDLYTAFGEATAPVAPELLALGTVKVEGFIAANQTLKTRFDFYLRDIVRQEAHTLTAEGEGLLAGMGAALQGPSDIRGQLVASGHSLADRQAVDRQGGQARRPGLYPHPRRTEPRRPQDDLRHLLGRIWQVPELARRGLCREAQGPMCSTPGRENIRPPSAAALSGGNVPEAVYRTLVAETNKGLPELHRYFELRRRLLKLPDMGYWDIYPPLVALDRKVTVPDMRTITLDALKPLGPEYLATFAKASAAKWMDPLPRPGKRSGAYMNPGAYDVHPYLLLNLGENYDGLTTYAHEWGHAIHSLLAAKAQVYEKADYTIFTAEIASTCNEQLLSAYMVGRAKTREEKLFYLGQQLEGIRGTFFRQAMFAEFELATHDKAEAGEGLSGETFTKLYLDLLKRYHGPKVTIEPAYGVEWAYIPHFYNSFYVYQYATSISAASFFARSILKGGAKERDNYLGVLKAGGSDYPVDILKRAGLDMASPAPYQAIVATFRDTLDQAEALMG